MKVNGQVLKDIKGRKAVALKHIETAKGIFQEACNQGNREAKKFAKSAIKYADAASDAYRQAALQVKRSESGIDELKKGSYELRQCEQMLNEAEASVKDDDDRT
jgi:hypothetical protein